MKGLGVGSAWVVEDAARAVPKNKRFGQRKVFISDVYDEIRRSGQWPYLTLEDFKSEVLDMNHRGSVELARADLVAAMPPDKVKRSETDAPAGAVYHFVVLDEPHPEANPSRSREAWAAEIERERAERERKIDKVVTAIYPTGAVIGRARGSTDPMMAIMSGEVSTPEYGTLRVTFFETYGPRGHDTAFTEREIAERILAFMDVDSIRVASDEDAIAWTSTPEYIDGSKRIAITQAGNTLRYMASGVGRGEWARKIDGRALDMVHKDDDLDGALALLEDAIREIAADQPQRNPPRGLVRNPPWVTEALAKSYDSIAEQVPPRWMPELAQVRSKGETISAQLNLFGCGAYGCVIGTSDEQTVLKVTSDETEAEFAAKLSPHLTAPICVDYRMVMRLPQRRLGSQIYLLWREAAHEVGQVRKVLGKDAMHFIDEQHVAGERAFVAIFTAQPRAVVMEAVSYWLERCEAIARQRIAPEIRPLGAGLIKVYEDQGILFGDLHAGNLGIVRRPDGDAWVITDPGHVVVIDRDE